MSFDVIQEKKPSYSGIAMAVIIALSVMIFGMAAMFAYLLISGKGSDYLLGTLLAFEFLASGVTVVLYARYFIPFREVSEDREEELLW